MKSDEQNPVSFEQFGQLRLPTWRIENVLDNQVVARLRVCAQGAMIAIEERGTHHLPVEVASLDARKRKNAAIAQMVDGDMPKRGWNGRLNRACKCRLARR